MKKTIFTTLMLTLFLSIDLTAQNFVSFAPQTKGVLIEEFTGRYCQYCPDGHVVANNIVHNNPGKAWAVNVHAGTYAPTNYPNFNTNIGEQIMYAFNASSFPTGVVNRNTTDAVGRGSWSSLATQELSQTAICNIGGQVVVDPTTRTANITVEVYYTSSSSSSTNYLNIIMLQDSIWGSQSGGSSNPEQYDNGYYCHMHVLRDAVTSTWGDAISQTHVGALITKQYTYQIPQVIGSPNGADVDLDNIYFLAFVTEKYQGTPTRPILNVNELFKLEGTSQDIYADIISVTQSSNFTCSNEKIISVAVNNGGLDDITSIQFETRVNNAAAVTHTWQGNIPSYESKSIDLEIELVSGNNNVKVDIVKVNGEDFNVSSTANIVNNGWEEMTISSEEEEVTIEIMQDKYGMQITWELLASDNSVIASGGPYTNISGASATQLHEVKAILTAGECVKFVIEDSMGNGICCNYGDGYYRIINANGDVILDGDGEFGSKAEHVLSVVYEEIPSENIEVHICEGESYTEYGFEFVNPEAGIYNEQNLYNGTLYILELVVVANPEVAIDGKDKVELGESVTLTASGADTYVWSTGETTSSIIVTPEVTTKFSVVGTKDGCEGNAEFTVEVALGLEENESVDANVYPNPTQGELVIECDAMKELTVIMPNGQVVERINVNGDKYLLDMSDYNSGVYYVKITTKDNNVITYKSVKM